MDKDAHAVAVAAAVAKRGEEIKQNSAEFLWVCCGLRPPLLPDKPVVTDSKIDPEHLELQRRLISGTARLTRGDSHDKKTRQLRKY
jgi:hypothetical protein